MFHEQGLQVIVFTKRWILLVSTLLLVLYSAKPHRNPFRSQNNTSPPLMVTYCFKVWLCGDILSPLSVDIHFVSCLLPPRRKQQ